MGHTAWNKAEHVAQVCQVCGAERLMSPAAAAVTKTCSLRCGNLLKTRLVGPAHPLAKPKVQKPCLQCGEIVECKPSIAHKVRFCSLRCHGSWRSANHPRVSSLERAVKAWLEERGLQFKQQAHIGSWHVDFLIRDLVVEVDGAYWHSLPNVIVRDAIKSEDIRAAGYRLLRVPEAAIHNGSYCELISDALGLAAEPLE